MVSSNTNENPFFFLVSKPPYCWLIFCLFFSNLTLRLARSPRRPPATPRLGRERAGPLAAGAAARAAHAEPPRLQPRNGTLCARPVTGAARSLRAPLTPRRAVGRGSAAARKDGGHSALWAAPGPGGLGGESGSAGGGDGAGGGEAPVISVTRRAETARVG